MFAQKITTNDLIDRLELRCLRFPKYVASDHTLKQSGIELGEV